MAELFPTQVRSAGLGLPYSATVAVFGGTAPYIVEWLTVNHHANIFPWYVSALGFISLIGYIRTPETKGIRLDQL
jgi:MHS family alpha-ketoglutarate permease-like MFS transporter